MSIRRLVRQLGLSVVLLAAAPSAEVWAELVMKVLVVNPSETDVKEFSVNNPLPPEIKPEHVLDADGLRGDYNSQTGTYLLTGTLTLKPKESVTRRIVLEDVWVIAPERFTDLRQETWMLLSKLRGTTYEEQGKLLSASVSRRLVAIETNQQQPSYDPQAHISRYRDNLRAVESIETELVSLRQLMDMAAVAPMAESVLGGPGGAGAAAGQERGGLSVLATWRVIFIVLGLLGFVSLSFFLLWQRQLKHQLAKQAEDEETDAAEALLANGHGAAGSAPSPARMQPKTPLSSY